MRPLRLVALVLVVASATAARSQGRGAVAGAVTSSATGQPVAGATVRVGGRGAAAGTDGRFLIADVPGGAARLRVSAVGYAPAEVEVEVPVGGRVWADVELSEAAVETGPVVVTATRTARDVEDVAVPTTVVTAEAMRQRGAVRLGDVLEDVPGLFVFDDHGGGVQVQGFDADYTLVLLDGEPVIGRTAGTLDVDRLAVAGVERVEVVEGPSSSLYGSEALAGVVNLVTALPAAGTEAGSARLRAGSYGESDLTAEAAVGRERWAVRVLADRFGSDGYDLTPEAFGPTTPSFTDWTGDVRAEARLGAGRLSLGARVAAQDQAGAFALDEGGAEVGYDDAGRRVDWSVHPEWTAPLGGGLRLTTTLYGARYQAETRHRRQSDGALAYTDDFDQRYAKAEAQLDAAWSGRHISVVGAGATTERLAGDRYGAGGVAPSARQGYAFAQHEWSPSRRLAVAVSARFDAHSDYAARLTPKASVLVRPAAGLRLRASVGSGFKAPAFRQLYLAFTNAAAGYSVFGATRLAEGLGRLEAEGQVAQRFLDPAALGVLEAENSVAVNAGLAADLAPGLTVEVGGFWNEVADLIETQPVAQKTNGQQVFGYFNLDRIYTRGLNAEVTARRGGVEVAASYQFLQARDHAVVDRLAAGTVFGRGTDGRDVQLSLADYGGLFGRSPHAVTARATAIRGRSVASLRARWRSRYGYRDLDGNGLANRDDEFVSGYAVVDLTLTHRVPLPVGRLEVQVGADNLLDVTRSTLVPSMPGRTLFASLGLLF
ncbi:TonB-dependent receptor [Rubrivirga sp. S365]|uniref:TonB-dependent receptor n=1 Tax=Rubrivirga litoralis TaxID=3075598 RepID=A0ABU3BT35_9BACT|nr:MULTISPECIES: TonB-dependent receptor [unclassified Rubrivirga]MDT0632449.1 TonB-dependent receptor [Rubrivirga sp. F394]MDT7857098.1 TonB-dependent receptor [Rubrivirga sp. S365]